VIYKKGEKVHAEFCREEWRREAIESAWGRFD
jgi:ribosomal protein L39E